MNDNKKLYPREIFNSFNGGKTFSVTGHFVPVEGEGSPLKIYQPGKSRLVFSVADPDNSSWVKTNLRIDEFAEVSVNTTFAHGMEKLSYMPVLHQMFSGIKEIQNMLRKTQEGLRMMYHFIRTGQTLVKDNDANIPNSPAASVVITHGKLKGKTPYQVLNEQGEEGLIALRSQHDWLSRNADKYPQNKEQIVAIEDAFRLREEGKISVSGASGDSLNFGIIPIHKGTPRPLIRQKDENGLTPVHELDIYWHIGHKNPVEVKITNYKAPINKDISLSQVIVSEGIQKQTESIRLTSGQWLHCVKMIESNMNRFEFLVANGQFHRANELEKLSMAQDNKD